MGNPQDTSYEPVTEYRMGRESTALDGAESFACHFRQPGAAPGAAAWLAIRRFGGTGYVVRQRLSCHAFSLPSYNSSHRGFGLIMLTIDRHQKCDVDQCASSGALSRRSDAAEAAA